jgi:hypothetical protein
MKCSYRFKINGNLRLAEIKPVQVRRMVYEFEADNGLVKAIRIITSISRDEWPQYEPNKDPTSEAKVTLNLNNHRMLFIGIELRGLEAILSLFGVTSIDMEHWEIEYIPENKDEKKALQITMFQQDSKKVSTSPDFVLGHDLLSSAVAASIHAELGNLTFPLSFFRKGRISIFEGRFIGAYYDFYFLLETLYGNAKTKNHAVEAEFKKSPEIRTAAEHFLALSNEDYPSGETQKTLMTKFNGYNVDTLVKYIVKQRGFFHHHTARKQNIWHPAHEEEYEHDALMIQDIAFHVLFHEVFKLFETESVQRDLRMLQIDDTHGVRE